MLLHTGGFYEANPLMRPVMENPLLGLAVKGVLPAVLLLLVRRMLRELGERELARVDRCASFVVALYTALCLVHIVNLTLWRLGIS